jgi:hypothetical protein
MSVVQFFWQLYISSVASAGSSNSSSNNNTVAIGSGNTPSDNAMKMSDDDKEIENLFNSIDTDQVILLSDNCICFSYN